MFALIGIFGSYPSMIAKKYAFNAKTAQLANQFCTFDLDLTSNSYYYEPLENGDIYVCVHNSQGSMKVDSIKKYKNGYQMNIQTDHVKHTIDNQMILLPKKYLGISLIDNENQEHYKRLK